MRPGPPGPETAAVGATGVPEGRAQGREAALLNSGMKQRKGRTQHHSVQGFNYPDLGDGWSSSGCT